MLYVVGARLCVRVHTVKLKGELIVAKDHRQGVIMSLRNRQVKVIESAVAATDRMDREVIDARLVESAVSHPIGKVVRANRCREGVQDMIDRMYPEV